MPTIPTLLGAQTRAFLRFLKKFWDEDGLSRVDATSIGIAFGLAVAIVGFVLYRRMHSES
jgi:hypothetical protein